MCIFTWLKYLKERVIGGEGPQGAARGDSSGQPRAPPKLWGIWALCPNPQPVTSSMHFDALRLA